MSIDFINKSILKNTIRDHVILVIYLKHFETQDLMKILNTDFGLKVFSILRGKHGMAYKKS